MASVSGGFLAPLFFAYLGLEFNLGAMSSASFVATVLVVSIVAKITAGWLGALSSGFRNRMLGESALFSMGAVSWNWSLQTSHSRTTSLAKVFSQRWCSWEL